MNVKQSINEGNATNVLQSLMIEKTLCLFELRMNFLWGTRSIWFAYSYSGRQHTCINICTCTV